MEPLKDLKLDVNRIILQLFIPGVFAVVPFFIFFLNNFPAILTYFKNSEGMATLCIFILALAVGLILEDIGSLIEYYAWDKINITKYPNHEIEWENYLKLSISHDTDLIAQRYLKTIITRMKFELSFSIAMMIMMIGLIMLHKQVSLTTSSLKFISYCIGIPICISGYLLYESFLSSRLLISTRKKILDNLEKVMSDKVQESL